MARIVVEVSVDGDVIARSESVLRAPELNGSDRKALELASEILMARATASAALNSTMLNERYEAVFRALVLEADMQIDLCSRALQLFFKVASGKIDPANTRYADLLSPSESPLSDQ